MFQAFYKRLILVGKSHLFLVSLSFLINNMGIKTSNPEVLFQGSRAISGVAVPCKVKRALKSVIITLNKCNRVTLFLGRVTFVPLHLGKQTSSICVLKIGFKSYILCWIILVFNHLGI